MVERPLLKLGVEGISKRTTNMVYSSVTWLNNESAKYNRQIYNIFDLLGDLGGVTEVIMISFGFFLFSISEHSFHVTAIKRLFYARTVDANFFNDAKSTKNKYLASDIIP